MTDAPAKPRSTSRGTVTKDDGAGASVILGNDAFKYNT
jgi:hypothetical protein